MTADAMPSGLQERARAALESLLRERGSLRARSLHSGLWLAASSVINRSLELLVAVVLSRLLAPEAFGLMSLALFFREGIDVTTQASFRDALIYQRDEIDVAADTAWVLGIARGLVVAGLVCAVAPLAAAFYREPLLEAALYVVALVFALNGLTNVHVVRFSRDLSLGRPALARAFGAVLNAVVVVTLALALRSVWALLIALLVSSLYELAISFAIQPQRPRFRFDRTQAWELIHYGKYLTGAGILVFITTRADDAIIGRMLGMRALGFYACAYLVANLPATHVTNVFGEVIFPLLSTLKDHRDRLRDTYLSILKLIAYVSLPAGVVLLVLSREIIVVLLGSRWEPAVAPLRILVLFGVARSIAATTGPLFKAVGRPNIILWAVLAKLVLIVSLLVPLTLRHGLSGAAVAVTVPMLLEQLYLWPIVGRQIGASPGAILRQLARPGLTAGVVAVALTGLGSLLPPAGVATLGLSFLAAAAAWYFAARWLDGPFFRRVLSA